MTALPSLTFLEARRPMPLMSLPVRTTVVQLQNARVMVSPGSTLSPERLRSAGAITDVVGPNLLHLGGMQAAASAFPGAKLWGPPGAAAKMPGLAWRKLGEEPWPHESELQCIELGGMPRVQELVFLHHASKSLLVADLAFNLEHQSGLGAWLVLHAFGTYDRFATSRLFSTMVKDRARFDAAVARLGALDFEHVVPAHGAVASRDAKRRLLLALRERGFGVHR